MELATVTTHNCHALQVEQSNYELTNGNTETLHHYIIPRLTMSSLSTLAPCLSNVAATSTCPLLQAMYRAVSLCCAHEMRQCNTNDQVSIMTCHKLTQHTIITTSWSSEAGRLEPPHFLLEWLYGYTNCLLSHTVTGSRSITNLDLPSKVLSGQVDVLL